jgi:tetratricopeptide (TPR) repeat protein
MTANLVKLQCLVKLERYADAVETAKLAKEEIHRQEGAEALYYFWSGRAYMGLAKYPEAEAEFAEAVQLSPKEAYDWYWLGTAQMGQNTPEKFEAAIKSYDRSLEMGKHDDAAPSVFKLTCLGALGKWKEVIDSAPAAREQQDNETGGAALVHFWVGRAHRMLNQFKEAETELAESCKLNPSDQYAFYDLGVVRMKLEKYADAIEPFRTSIKLGYLEPDLFAALERALVLTSKPADAIAVSDDAIKRLKADKKELGTVYFWRGSAHMAQQKWDDADSDFTNALANESEANYKLYSRGSVRIMKGDFKAALADLQKIEKPEEMTDRDPDVYTLLARCHVELEQWPEAHASAERAAALCTKLKRSLEKPIFWRGRADFGAAELTKAEADFAEAVKLGPKAARNHYWLARTYAAEGKHSEAVAAFKEAKAGEFAADLQDLDDLLKQSEEKAASADAKP